MLNLGLPGVVKKVGRPVWAVAAFQKRWRTEVMMRLAERSRCEPERHEKPLNVHLSDMTMETEGSYCGEFGRWNNQHNPLMVHSDFILPGQTIMLKEYGKNKESQ